MYSLSLACFLSHKSGQGRDSATCCMKNLRTSLGDKSVMLSAQIDEHFCFREAGRNGLTLLPSLLLSALAMR